MKATRKLIPALAMLIVSAVVMSTASFAWFTMSREVTAQGMNVTVAAPNNLLISATEDGSYEATATTTKPATGLLPASTADGKNFFCVKDGAQLGDVATGALSNQTAMVVGKEITASSANDDKGYVDFVYYIKNEGSTDVSVFVNDIILTNNNADEPKKTVKPVRFAVIDGTTATQFNAGDGTNFDHDFTTNETPDVAQAVISEIDNSTTFVKTYAKSTYTAKGNSANAVITGINKTAKPFTIRVWFEGQDKECTNTSAAGATFDLAVKLTDTTFTG